MKSIITIIILCLLGLASKEQTQEGGLLSQEYSKIITEYYCKQYIVDEILKPIDGQSLGVYIYAVTAAKSGELTTVLYQCNSMNKKGVVFAFWNNYSNGLSPYKGYSFYPLDLEQAKVLFNKLESLMDQKKTIVDENMGNLVYKMNDLTFLFYKDANIMGVYPIRVWWKPFDSDWSQGNLRTTIKRFRTFFDLSK